MKENVRVGELLAISGGHVMSVIEEPIFSDGTKDLAIMINEDFVIGSKYEFNCLCGSDHCRGKVTGKDWMIPELQKRYDGFFSWYLQEKIDKLKVLDGSKRTTT